jgi:hypothetical protein
MPGPVHRGNAAEPVAHWKDGKLLDADGVGTLLSKRGAEWFAGKSAAPKWRTNGNVVYRAGSSEPFCRIVRGEILKGNSYEVLYRVRGDALLKGASVAYRGAGLSEEELLLAALVLDGA